METPEELAALMAADELAQAAANAPPSVEDALAFFTSETSVLMVEPVGLPSEFYAPADLPEGLPGAAGWVLTEAGKSAWADLH